MAEDFESNKQYVNLKTNYIIYNLYNIYTINVTAYFIKSQKIRT